MNPNHYAWVTDNMTFVSPLGLGVTLILCLALLFLPRRYAIVPVLALTCFMTMGQRVVLGGLNFTMIRILLLFGWARLAFRGEFRRIQWNAIDFCLIAWAISGFVAHSILEPGDAAYRLGVAYNCVGTYFLMRYLLRERDDVVTVMRLLAWFVIPLSMLMLWEHFSGHNIFAFLGGVPAISEIREGKIRSQGPFGHSILGGTFGATVFPFFYALRFHSGTDRVLGYMGMLASLIIVFSSGSSGPAFALIFSIIAFCLWPVRQHMRALRWGLLALAVVLHLVMKAPVWFLIGRITVFQASTGFHRAMLIDAAIRNFSEWWLVGTPSTAHWGYELMDVTNYYIRQGVEGGFLTLVLFMAVISYAFGAVGRARKAAAKQPRWEQMMIWALGAALLAHAVSFISVSYFDQNFVSWYLLLAMISHISTLKPAEQQVIAPAKVRRSWRDMQWEGVAR
ncbi:MAG TPA: hypothetical protein VFA02_10015 [Pseudacidobacterium sp.]|nr:hypothetical protein [Pseudacidobacterium sp.]